LNLLIELRRNLRTQNYWFCVIIIKEQFFDWTTNIAGRIFKVKPLNGSKHAIF
jgi:hypothetical protein